MTLSKQYKAAPSIVLYGYTVQGTSQTMDEVSTPAPLYSEQVADLPPEYILPNPSFPSALDTDDIFHDIEGYVDHKPDLSFGDGNNVEETDIVDHCTGERDRTNGENQPHYALAQQASRTQSPTQIHPIAPKRESTTPSAGSISTRTRITNARLTRRKMVPRGSFADPNLVTWEGPYDSTNPHNWPRHRKWTSTILIAAFAFIAPMASTIVAPALNNIADEFHVERDSTEAFLIMSIFLLAFAIGPFLWGPLSEIFGRARVMQCANLIFLLFNTVCGFAKTKEQMMAFRFMSGIGGSAPQAIGSGIVSDCFRANERGTAIAIYSLMPFVSPAVSPIIGGYLTQYTTWRWAFWGTSMLDLLVQIACLFLLKETFAQAILAKKVAALRKETGNRQLHTTWQGPDRTTKGLVFKCLARPFKMLATQPALQAMALYRAYQYGLMYLVFATFPMVFENSYGQEVGRASLNYLSLGVGFVTGLQFSKSLQDKIYKWCKAQQIDPTSSVFSRDTWKGFRQLRNLSAVDTSTLILPGQTSSGIHLGPALKRLNTRTSFSDDPTRGLPEYRLPLLVPFSLFVPIGLFMYGWAAESRVHWIVPNVGCFIFAMGLIVCFNCAQAYVVDTYTTYSASATGAAAFVRTMAGFSFPLFAPKMYGSLGLGWGNSVLGFVALTFGLVAPILLWRWGGWLRSKSTYCTG